MLVWKCSSWNAIVVQCQSYIHQLHMTLRTNAPVKGEEINKTIVRCLSKNPPWVHVFVTLCIALDGQIKSKRQKNSLWTQTWKSKISMVELMSDGVATCTFYTWMASALCVLPNLSGRWRRCIWPWPSLQLWKVLAYFPSNQTYQKTQGTGSPSDSLGK